MSEELAVAPLTVASLYRQDYRVRVMIDTWVAEHRCPAPLGDLLEEYDLPKAADCARWAATEPDRPVFNRPSWPHQGPYPRYGCAGLMWYWLVMSERLITYANEIPRLGGLPASSASSDSGAGYYHDVFTSAREAIIWLLDHWAGRA